MRRYSNGDVHKIGILDLRLFNTDRHSGNMLVNVIEGSEASHAWRDEQCELIPIDHGFCLPEALEPPYFEWMHWPQVSATKTTRFWTHRSASHTAYRLIVQLHTLHILQQSHMNYPSRLLRGFQNFSKPLRTMFVAANATLR